MSLPRSAAEGPSQYLVTHEKSAPIEMAHLVSGPVFASPGARRGAGFPLACGGCTGSLAVRGMAGQEYRAGRLGAIFGIFRMMSPERGEWGGNHNRTCDFFPKRAPFFSDPLG